MKPITWHDVKEQYDHIRLLGVNTTGTPVLLQDTTCHENSLDQTVLLTALTKWKISQVDGDFYQIPHEDIRDAVEAINTLAKISEESFFKSYVLDELISFFEEADETNATLILSPQG